MPYKIDLNYSLTPVIYESFLKDKKTLSHGSAAYFACLLTDTFKGKFSSTRELNLGGLDAKTVINEITSRLIKNDKDNSSVYHQIAPFINLEEDRTKQLVIDLNEACTRKGGVKKPSFLDKIKNITLTCAAIGNSGDVAETYINSAREMKTRIKSYNRIIL